MAKLVVLNEGLAGQSFELKSEKTTIGRVEDNNFQLAVGSVSSHHCEILLRGKEVVVKDLNSTNGTFVNGQQVTKEAVLGAGQTLRLGQVELRLDDPTAPAPAPGAPATGAAPAVAPIKKPLASTMVISKGVSMEQLEQGPQGFDTKGVFTRKRNNANLYFVIGGVVLFLAIVVIVLVILNSLKSSGS